MFDARLPQKRHPNEVVLLKEPYLLDYSISTAHPNGDDHVMDVFNAVLDQVGAEFPHTVVVDPNSRGWDKQTMLLPTRPIPTRSGAASWPTWSTRRSAAPRPAERTRSSSRKRSGTDRGGASSRRALFRRPRTMRLCADVES